MIKKRYPGGKRKAFNITYDDGVLQDVRFVELMNKYGLKGTFNLSGGLFAPEGTVYPQGQIHRRLTKSAALELYEKEPEKFAALRYRALTSDFSWDASAEKYMEMYQNM